VDAVSVENPVVNEVEDSDPAPPRPLPYPQQQPGRSGHHDNNDSEGASVIHVARALNAFLKFTFRCSALSRYYGRFWVSDLVSMETQLGEATSYAPLVGPPLPAV